MNYLKSNQRIFSKFNLVAALLLIFIYNTVVAEETIFFDKLYKPPAQDLDLSIDLNKLYSHSERPNFTGSWVIEPSKSDEPKEVLKKSNKTKKEVSNRGNGNRSGRGSKGSRKGGKGSRNNDRSSSNSYERNIGLSEIKKMLVNEMEITHQEPLLKIYSKQNGEQNIYTDFRSSTISAAVSGVNQDVVVSGWEGKSLIIETTRSNGLKSIQTLSLITDHQRLEKIIEVSVQNQDMKSIRIRQIYLNKK